MTAPSVPYRIRVQPHLVKKYGGEELDIHSPAQWLNRAEIESALEPVVYGTIIAPQSSMSDVTSLCHEARGEQINLEFIDQHRLKTDYILPLAEIVTDFFDTLKTVTSGYGSFDYEDYGFRAAPLVKLEIRLNGEPVEELASIVHGAKAREKGKEMVAKLAENLPRQQYAIAIQVIESHLTI